MITKNEIFFLIIAAMLIIVQSCKNSDESVTPVVPQPVELFSKDSISVSSSDSGAVMLGDSITYQITDSTIKDIKLQYYMETSGNGSGDRIYYGIFLSKTGVSYFSDYGYPFGSKIRDTTLTFNVTNYKGLTLKAKVAIEAKGDYTFKYAKFKNIKLTKID